MARIKWTDRTFNFDFPVELFPEVLERIRGTPTRLEERLDSLPSDLLTRRQDERWSIQENAGHLLDLEPLCAQRLEEYEAGATVLHAADMSNQKTYEADHNKIELPVILRDFRAARGQLVARLERIDASSFARVAQHPRLNVPMRLVDMLYFQAEHDDYHLARIGELIKLFLHG